MHTLSKPADRAEYLAHMLTTCKLGNKTVSVHEYKTTTRSGSYARGLKFHITRYGYLVWASKTKGTMISFDHGVTWHWTPGFPRLAFERTKKLKVVLERETQKEFAYDKIQRLNQRYGY